VDPANIAIIVNLPPPKSVWKLRETLGHTGYYKKIIKGYAKITAPMEKMLKKDTIFQWNEDCQQGLETLKEKMVTTPILVFPGLGKDISCACRCINHNTWRNYSASKSKGFRPSYILYKKKIFRIKEKLQHHRKGRLSYGICTSKVQTIFSRETL
jgi:hypothetical protein